MDDSGVSPRTGETVALGVFVLLVGAAALFGAQFEPGAWYEVLQKPPLTPPNWVFGPVWSVLYLAIAVAGWIVWRARRNNVVAVALWGTQLALNAAWSFLFFGLQRPGLALLEIGVLLVFIVATAVTFFRTRFLAGALFVPYAAWVGFAFYLNAAIWYLNR
jgi:tryptophan-rich sensory protein